jgi:hypothetical protein
MFGHRGAFALRGGGLRNIIPGDRDSIGSGL